MKRFLPLLAALICLLCFSTLAQDAAEQEEKIKRLAGDIETLLAANMEKDGYRENKCQLIAVKQK